eukprot:3113808-Lingulodinium_polyedra.AAC.1
MDRTQKHGRGMVPGVAKKSPSTLLIKPPAESPRKEPPRRTTGIPGRAAGRGARGPMACEKSTKLRPCA